MNRDSLGELWALPLKHKKTLAVASESIIERTYRMWLKPGDVAVDVGVNVGRHLFPLADCVGVGGRVFGFEPIPELAAQLQVQIRDKDLVDRVLLQNIAIADQAGIETFHHNLAAPAMSGLKVRAGLPENSQSRAIQVRVDILDDVLSGHSPRFVKIDVEGAEFLVFRGATRLMKDSRPLFAF